MSQFHLSTLTPRVVWSSPDEIRDRPILGAVLGERSTLLVEAGASPAHARQLLEAVQMLGGAPARFVAVTHWHWDHVFGIATLGLPTLAHRETCRRVLEMARLDWRDAALDARVARGQENTFIAEHMKVEMDDAERAALVIAAPDVIFDERIEVDLGAVTVQVIHVGGDHSPDSSVVFVPQEKVVFLGDCFYAGFIGSEWYYTSARLFPLLDTLLALDAEYYLLAHAPTPLLRAEFVRDAAALRQIGEIVRQTGGDRPAAVQRVETEFGGADLADRLLDLDAFLRGLQDDIPVP
jgi:glyoxylase-like metal-dependent hydrolase (beta-lactamase superfamily II)